MIFRRRFKSAGNTKGYTLGVCRKSIFSAFAICVFAISALLVFSSAQAFAVEDEEASGEQAELQSSVKGGTSFNNATTLPLNTTNSFTQDKQHRDYYYKFTVANDGYITLSEIDAGIWNVPSSTVKIYNSSREAIYEFGDFS